ncbi:ATP-binding cassette domain-containing protein [Agrococcus sp. SGAir0287]|uniref:ATP-binding cassette domain-containing protein n=1 Tax=Agrococcus sp. SGAir0287 TaxID=2070347 RepID=UPI0010CD2018|nr:ATP-binding cassette domain-containing protein [Agrococcus sp. SGAir0287]QCR19741.1 multidrug ABC transporter ATP-binding protein [Agrococcus sp. SGAir0287]
MIVAEHLTKRYGAKVAVDDVGFEVRPGLVTGFLGPNGAGKSTTMRMIVGLDRPDAGSVTVSGVPYRELRSPLTEVGALLDAKAWHPGRTAERHLLGLAATHGIGRDRVREVLELTGLESVARKRVGGFSLGMGQRLGIAAALLGDPHTLILDEPVNGLDPEGVAWVRRLLRGLASEGRAVLLSSHLMSEMAQVADRVVVLGKGRVLADQSIEEMLGAQGSRQVVLVRGSGVDRLAHLLAGDDVTTTQVAPDAVEVSGVPAPRIAEVAVGAGIGIEELAPRKATLEERYMALTSDAVEYRTEGIR